MPVHVERRDCHIVVCEYYGNLNSANASFLDASLAAIRRLSAAIRRRIEGQDEYKYALPLNRITQTETRSARKQEAPAELSGFPQP